MVTKDIPMVIAEESVRRLAQSMQKDIEEGRIIVDARYYGSSGWRLDQENLLFFAALALITKKAQWN